MLMAKLEAMYPTGSGELVMKTAVSFFELMRSGLSSGEACREGVERIVKKMPDHRKCITVHFQFHQWRMQNPMQNRGFFGNHPIVA